MKLIEVLLVLMLICAFLSLQLKDMLAAVIILGVFSLLSSLIFFLFHAPDVALTEAAVGTGIGTLILIWIVHKTGRGDRT